MDVDQTLEDAVRSLPPSAGEQLRRMVEAALRPMVSGDPRRHHYVPQFYLRGFANSDRQVAKIRLEEPHAPIVTNVENVAVIKDFYTSKDESGADIIAIERLLQHIDGEASSIVRALGERTEFAISVRDRAKLALWCAFQKVRDPFSRRTWEAMGDMLVKVMMPTFTSEEDAREYLAERDGESPSDESVEALLKLSREPKTWEATPHQNEHLRIMLDSALTLAPHIFHRPWLLLRYASPVVVTSDRPVCLYVHPENRDPNVGVGVGTADEIHIPLDRRNVLVLHDRPHLDGILITMPVTDRGDQENQVIVSHAWQEIFCHPDDVERVLRLELPPPDQPLAMMESGGVDESRWPDGVNVAPTRRRVRRYRR